MNYYVDEAALEITEKNLFTAMEVETLIPLHGPQIFAVFKEVNNWSAAFLPAYVTPFRSALPMTKNIFKWILKNCSY